MIAQAEKKVVLVVDDAPANIRVVNEILHDTYKVRIATNGAKALELARGTPGPDLILLDVIMPGMDGYEVCAHLKQGPATRDIPVIFLTGQTDTADETRGFEVGAVDYIHKPFSPAVVAARVQTHLALRETRGQLERQLVAIRNELETARQIQLSILPRELPAIAGLDIAARYIPMTSVAGDFYDFLVVDEKRVGVLMADVSGHGMPAALIASMLKIAFAAQSPHALDPAAGAVRLEPGTVREVSGPLRHRGLCANRYRKPDHHLRGRRTPSRSCCGKTRRALRARLRRTASFSATSRTPRTPPCRYPSRKAIRLLLYTDGISEMMDPSEEQFGEARLKLFLEEHRDLSAAGFVDRLLDRLSLWSSRASGEDPDDDVTVLAIRYRRP